MGLGELVGDRLLAIGLGQRLALLAQRVVDVGDTLDVGLPGVIGGALATLAVHNGCLVGPKPGTEAKHIRRRLRYRRASRAAAEIPEIALVRMHQLQKRRTTLGQRFYSALIEIVAATVGLSFP